jgi:hypothetical protein
MLPATLELRRRPVLAAQLMTARRVLIVALLPLATACAAPAAAPAAQQAPAPAVPQAPAAGPALPAPKLEVPVATELTQQAPRPAIPAPEQAGGIALGQPLLIGSRMAAIQVTNTTDLVKTFTIRLTYKQGDKSNELSGTVSDLRPKQTGFATINTYALLTGAQDSASIAVTGVKDATTTPKAEANARLKLGEPSAEGGAAKATVQVSNGDDKSHGFTVRAGFLKGGELVGYAEQQVTDLPAGQGRTVSLTAMNTVASYDQVQASIVGLIR